jgi:hypothetical protein
MAVFAAGTALGAEVLPYSFMGTRSQPPEAVVLAGQGYAWWDFSLPGDLGHHVLIRIEVWALGSEPSLKVCLAVRTPASRAWRPFCPTLKRLAADFPGGIYFGELVISRRDFDLGSWLEVKLYPYSTAGTIRVGYRSVTLVTAGPAGEGSSATASYRQAAPAVSCPVLPVKADWDGDGDGDGVSAISLPETDSSWNATWVAPGLYRGVIGGYSTCRCHDTADWFKVNLQPGQTLKVALKVESGVSCGLALYDPRGHKVASVNPGRTVALEYWAGERGQWYIEVFTTKEPIAESRYELLVDIR